MEKTLNDEIRQLIEENAQSRAEVRRCGSAIHAFIIMVLKRKPSAAMLEAGRAVTALPLGESICNPVYCAMTAELLKELEGKP